MSEKVVFSQLSRKFIDENDATPAEAQQVVYYSLAIGCLLYTSPSPRD